MTGKPSNKACVSALLCFDITNLYVNTVAQQVEALQHTERFTYTGTHTDVDTSFPRDFYQVKKLLYCLIFICHQNAGANDDKN